LAPQAQADRGPFRYLIEVMDIAVFLVFALSFVTTAFGTLFHDPK